MMALIIYGSLQIYWKNVKGKLWGGITMNTILGLLFLYIALNFLIVTFVVGVTKPSDYEEE